MLPSFTRSIRVRTPLSRHRGQFEQLEPRTVMAGDAILHWDEVALEVVSVDHTLPTLKEQAGPVAAARALAIVHGAMFDAINSSHGKYEPYLIKVVGTSGADVDAAVGQAARDTLVSLYPGQASTIDAALASWLGQIADGKAENLATLIGDLFSSRRTITTAPSLAPGARPTTLGSTPFGQTAPAITTTTTSTPPPAAAFQIPGATGTTTNEVRVMATEFAFVPAGPIPAGVTRLLLEDVGQQPHHLELYRLEGGKTLADLLPLLAGPAPLPRWVVAVGGPGAVEPGETVDSTMLLDPGSYAYVCYAPDSAGVPHYRHGMVGSAEIAPRLSAISLHFPKTSMRSACAPLVMKVLVPVTAISSPRGSKRVVMPVASDPAVGSVITSDASAPAATLGRRRCFCSSVPKSTSGFIAWKFVAQTTPVDAHALLISRTQAR